jgi:hypothetical protein
MEDISKDKKDSIEIVTRFFLAIDELVAMNRLRGIKTFTDMYDLDRRNFIRIRKNKNSKMFQLSWIVYIVRDFGVSMEWIMTGRGKMFS